MLLTNCLSRVDEAPARGGRASITGLFELPVPEAIRLRSGLEVWLFRSNEVPLVTMSLVIRSGSFQDPRGKEGLAALTANMLDEGAGERGALEIADEIDYLGAAFSIDAERERTQISLQVLLRNLDPALAILGDVVARPTFLEKEWDRVKTLWLNEIIQRREEPREVARIVAERAFYGEDHPYAHPTAGYESTVKAIALEDLKAFYAAHVRPSKSVLLIVGDLTPEDLRTRLEKALAGWTDAGPAPPDPEPPASAAATRLIVVEKPDAPQTEIRILVPGPSFASGEVPPLLLDNIIFGGSFTSRLTVNLREKNHFTYGASSAFSLRRGPGYLVAASAVHTEKTGAALAEFCREFRAMETGSLTEEELAKAHSTISTRVCEALQTQEGKLEIYTVSAALGGVPEERRQFYRKVDSTTGPEASAEARERYHWDRATIVLVGDKAAIESQLKDLRASPPLDLSGRACTFPEVELRDRDGGHTSG